MACRRPRKLAPLFGYGEAVDVFLQSKRNGVAAKRFFKRLLKSHKREPRKIVTDKLRSYGVAHRELIPDSMHDTSQYANNRSELSHQPTRVRERVMRRFKSITQAQRFLDTHASVYNLFNLGRHLITASHYRSLRTRRLDIPVLVFFLVFFRTPKCPEAKLFTF
ncbi:MAG: putative transposase [Arenicella sp.]